jgi:hypothetical protein
MAKKRSEKSNFQSNYGGGNISPAQYITEQICAKIAKKKGSELPPKFWVLPAWEKYFRQQIPAANKLLKKYPYQVIVVALRDKRMWWLESLRAKQFLPILDEYLLIEQSKPQPEEDIVEETTQIAKPLPSKSGIASKLKGL